jgi:hypothetical protein
MKKITISCHELTTISENHASNFRKKLMLLLFLFVASTSAFAQLTSCFVTGDGVSAPFPQAVIEACADGSNLNYRATPSVPSTFSWVLSLNTSGATIVGTSTAQSIEVNPGNAEGLFTLTCTVTSIATSVQNFCAVSVAVYKPTVTPVPAARCGPGDITLGASGLGFNSVANWYAASSGGVPIFTGSSYTTTVPSTTSFWVSSAVTTPFLSLICESPRVEVVATVNQPATVNANNDQIICAGSTVTLAGSVGGGASSGTWSSSGTGLFSPGATTLNAVYTPSAADATAGTITLTLTTNDPVGPCIAASDAMVLTINPPATANANIDQTICAGSTVTLAGSIGGGASSGTWSSSGTGLFSPGATTLNAVYTPSAADITAGTITLTLTTNDPVGPCIAASDAMVVTINPPATANANIDQTICVGEAVTLAGSVGGGASSGTWSSSGTGLFSPGATTLNAVYTPSAADVTAGTITLTLTTNDPVGPCIAASDAMVVIIESCAQEGCTLGYWKNHTDRWCQDYRTCDLFGNVFVDAPSSLANLTLLEALNLGGGGIYNLARQGVAALLNTCSDEVDYAGYFNNSSSVIDAVNAAYRADGTAPGLLASELDYFNNSGCPLGGTRANKATNCIDSAPTTDTTTETGTIKTELAGFTASPVPFKNQLTIRYDFDYQSDVTIEVFNAQGVLVFSKLDTNSYLNKEVTFDIKVNKGQEQVYIVKLTTDQGSSTRKVMSSR